MDGPGAPCLLGLSLHFSQFELLKYVVVGIHVTRWSNLALRRINPRLWMAPTKNGGLFGQSID